ncbi:MAG: hypothetical protein IK078_05735 [Lachnospiraceae bacterium]|nr:hypothetical protein [Lachnospiraceae bacterium]
MKIKSKLRYIPILCLLILLCLSWSVFAADKANSSVKKDQYTITPKAGTYEKGFKIQISAKKGYRIYYTTGSKFSVKKFVKPGKTKSITVKKDVTLRVYYVKKNVTLSAKKLNSATVKSRAQKYNYKVQNKSSESEDSDSGSSDQGSGDTGKSSSDDSASETETIDENGSYTTKDDVALYLYTYRKLPKNFITKKEAQALGWSGGGLDGYKDGYCIGGDYFGNYEGRLPEGNYHECDIDTMHQSKRGAKRIIYSDDGRIYYTDDHYETFTLLYDGWKK